MSAASVQDAPPVCENCRRIVAPKVYTTTLLVDGGLVGQRRLCRACLTHATDAMAQAAPWLDTALGRR